jgi:hypothetical protein
MLLAQKKSIERRLMPPKFGTFLFQSKNKRSPHPASAPGAGRSDPFEPLNAKLVSISPAEIEQSDLHLFWDLVPDKQVLVPIAVVTGLKEGRAGLRAADLATLAPQLFETVPPEDLQIPLVLSRVIAQVETLLRPVEQAFEIERPFDTPFSQAMREDEAKFAAKQRATPRGNIVRKPHFGQLFKADPAESPPPELTPEDRPDIPLEFLREKAVQQPPNSRSPIKDISSDADGLEDPKSFVSEAAIFTEPEPLAQSAPEEPPSPDSTCQIPTAHPPAGPRLPNPSSPTEDRSKPDQAQPVKSPAATQSILEIEQPQSQQLPAVSETAKAERPVPPAPIPVPQAAQVRIAQDRLQELFLTDEYLDGRTVAEHILGLPKVKGVLILLGNDTVLGQNFDERLSAGVAIQVPSLFEQISRFSGQLASETLNSVTLHTTVPISIIKSGRVHILVVHTGRNLVPGLRERLVETAKALDDMYKA